MRRFLITFFILVIFLLIACQNKKPNRLTFIPIINGQPITCEDDFLVNEQKWHLRSFQFYISKIQLNGEMQNINYDGNLKEVNNRLALVGGTCRDALNWQIELKSEAKLKSVLEFELAVPFELNHKNPLTAQFPLNQSDMFWTWQLGHKFLRLDLVNQTEKDENWSFHLGSTGCDSASVMRSPKSPCKNPNRVSFSIKDFESNKPIYITFNNLVSGLELSKKTSCMGDLNQSACSALYQNLNQRVIFTQDIERTK
jgi:uncharacterized repeat protein (TIGR04052 family)